MKKNTKSISEIFDDYKNEREKIFSGFYNLDKSISDFSKGDVIILGGRPAMGKTSFAISLCRNISPKNFSSVVYFSLQKSNTQLLKHLFKQSNNKELNNLISSNIYVCDNSKIDYKKIEFILNKQEKDIGVDIVIIDYFQLLEYKSSTEFIEKLKKLAIKNGFAVILLSQIKRIVDQRKNKRPLIKDLIDINGEDKNIDSIFFIYRSNYYSKNFLTEENQSDLEIIIAKHNKFVQIETVAFTFNNTTSEISNKLEEYTV